MGTEGKRNALEHALQEHLVLANSETVARTAADVVKSYHGQEVQLYDTVSVGGLETVCNKSCSSDQDVQMKSVRNH